MRRALVIALLALAAAPAAHAASVTASVTPARVHLGDPFTYTVVARVPSPQGGVRVIADAGAFDVLAGPSESHSSDHGAAVVRVTETLACLTRACVANLSPRAVVLPRPQVLVGRTPTAGSAVTVTVAPRVPPSAVSASRAKYLKDTDPPAATSRLPLGAAAALAIALAVILAAGAVALVAAEVRRGPAEARAAQGRVAAGLETALRLLRESARRPVPDRRRAADLVARLAGPDAAADAQRVAWARPSPQPADVEGLADEVERGSRA